MAMQKNLLPGLATVLAESASTAIATSMGVPTPSSTPELVKSAIKAKELKDLVYEQDFFRFISEKFGHKDYIKPLDLKVKVSKENHGLLETELALNQNYAGFLTEKWLLKLVPIDRVYLLSNQSEEAYPIFQENEKVIPQKAEIKKISLRSGREDKLDLIGCLYNSNELSIYQILDDEEKRIKLYLRESVELNNIGFFRWYHIGYYSVISIVHGFNNSIHCLWDIHRKMKGVYQANAKILDIAYSNYTRHLAISSDNDKIAILNEEGKILFEIIEKNNQNIIFLDKDFLLCHGKTRPNESYLIRLLVLNFAVIFF